MFDTRPPALSREICESLIAQPQLIALAALRFFASVRARKIATIASMVAARDLRIGYLLLS
jgi:hypothetical protein